MAALLNNEGKLRQPTDAEILDADEAAEIICFTDGTMKNGAPYWAYVAVKPSRYAAFMNDTRARKSLILTDYGRVLKRGNELSVPVATQQEMKRDFGVQDNYFETLLKKARAEQSVFLKQKEEKRINDIVAMMKRQQQAKKKPEAKTS